MASSPSVGQAAPPLRLPGVVVSAGEAARGDYALSEQRGHPVVLAFYPGDNTAVCTRQLCSYAQGLEQFNALGALVWGISPQSVDSHEKFARKQNLTFPLLADTTGAAITDYGIKLPGLGLRRSVFLVDADGVLRWKHVGLVGLTYQTVETITKEIANL
jgi:thioredoxin-dependent peroxiredoxin